jgi:hypothetical protein
LQEKGAADFKASIQLNMDAARQEKIVEKTEKLSGRKEAWTEHSQVGGVALNIIQAKIIHLYFWIVWIWAKLSPNIQIYMQHQDTAGQHSFHNE